MTRLEIAADDRHQRAERAGQRQGVETVPGPAAELQAQHQAAAVHALEHLRPGLHQTVQTGAQMGAQCGDPGDDRAVVGSQAIEHRERDRCGEAVHRESRAVLAVEIAAPGLVAVETGADRHQAAAQRLGQQQHVRLHALGLRREQMAGAPQAGLDLVEHEQRAVAFAQGLGRRQITGRRRDHAGFALHRFDEERGHALLAQDRFQRIQIAVGHVRIAVAADQERLAIDALAGDADRAEGLAVETGRRADHQFALGRRAREFDRGLDHFRAAGSEVDPGHAPGRQFDQAPRQGFGVGIEHRLHIGRPARIEETRRRVGDRLRAVAERYRAELADEIDQFLAAAGDDAGAMGAGDAFVQAREFQQFLTGTVDDGRWRRAAVMQRHASAGGCGCDGGRDDGGLHCRLPDSVLSMVCRCSLTLRTLSWR